MTNIGKAQGYRNRAAALERDAAAMLLANPLCPWTRLEVQAMKAQASALRRRAGASAGASNARVMAILLQQQGAR